MRRHSIVVGAVFVIALAALAAVRSGAALHPPLPRAQAVRAATRSPGVDAYLRANPWTRARVIALDQQNWRVTFSDGPKLVLDVAIGPHGEVTATQPHARGSQPLGSRTLWTPAVLVLLAAVFAFAVAGWPLRSRRNRDALIIAGGFTLSALLLDARLIGPQVYVGAATLAYVAFRLARVGFGRSEAVAVEPLYRRALAFANPDRTLALLTAALFLAGVVAVVTATNPSDVAFAGLAGATLLNHGTVPYGHMSAAVVHGDTYPLLSYALYIPFAAVSPVRDAFDSLDGALWLNALALAIGTLLLMRRGGRAQALAWLAFPPVLLAAASGGNDVPAAAFVIAALVLFARPLWSVALLALAGWVKIVPAVALVPWIARLAPGPARRAAVIVAALLAAGVLAIVIIGGGGALPDAWHAIRFQFVRGSWYSVWQQTGTRWLQLVFQAGVIAFAAAVALELRHRRAADVRQTAALAGAIIALLQISANYWTYTYLPWLLPFILAALFPPARPRSQPLAPPVP